MAERGDELRLELMSLTEKIDSANSDIIGSIQQQLHEAEDRRAKAEKEVTKQKSAITLNDRNIEKARARKSDLEGDAEGVSVKFGQLDEQEEALRAKLKEVEERIEEKKGRFAKRSRPTRKQQMLRRPSRARNSSPKRS